MKTPIIFLAAAATMLTSAVKAEDTSAAFPYQGRVKVQGQPFSGQGQFKFAILDHEENSTLWTHDGSGLAGQQPTSHLVLPVDDGVFSLIMGDVAGGMQPISSTIFNSRKPLKLRVWFNDGERGFQQLNPDHKLVNLTLNVLETGTQDFSIYVDATAGSDSNNGLTPTTPKKTIQAAVDSLPDRLNCNVVIDIASGTYPEEVEVHGISVSRKKKLTFRGDEAWTGSTAAPAVVISGLPAPGNEDDARRDYCVYVSQSTGIDLEGIHFTGAGVHGLHIENGVYNVRNSLSTGNGNGGFSTHRQADANFTNCASNNNGIVGFTVSTASRSVMTSCSATYNGAYGVRANNQSQCSMGGLGEYSYNGSAAYTDSAGIVCGPFSDMGTNFVGYIRNNKGHGLNAKYHGYIIYSQWPGLVISGNTKGSTTTSVNGTIYP